MPVLSFLEGHHPSSLSYMTSRSSRPSWLKSPGTTFVMVLSTVTIDEGLYRNVSSRLHELRSTLLR